MKRNVNHISLRAVVIYTTFTSVPLLKELERGRTTIILTVFSIMFCSCSTACVSLVSLNGDDKPKQKTSESGDNVEDNPTKEDVSEVNLTTEEADSSHSAIIGKDGD